MKEYISNSFHICYCYCYCLLLLLLFVYHQPLTCLGTQKSLRDSRTRGEVHLCRPFFFTQICHLSLFLPRSGIYLMGNLFSGNTHLCVPLLKRVFTRRFDVHPVSPLFVHSTGLKRSRLYFSTELLLMTESIYKYDSTFCFWIEKRQFFLAGLILCQSS